jgi:hypothetical protein
MMEAPTAKIIRIFRSEETILNILIEHRKSKLSIKAFCKENNIAQASFHNWKKKYGKRTIKQAGFATLQISPPAGAGASLFAEVKEIKIYQWVTAAYLKELLA